MSLIDEDSIRSISKDNNVKKTRTNLNADVTESLDQVIEFTINHLKESSIEKTTNWMLYSNLWLNNEEGVLTQSFYNYSRGDIILSLDLGTTNIGTEIRYPHPCVVLYDNKEDWVIVAPITSAQVDKETGKPIVHLPFEVYIEAQKKPPKNNNEFFFRKKSVIQVDQICRISKYRAVNKTTKKLRTDLLNQIDNVILQNYVPNKHSLLEKLKEINSELSSELAKKDLEIETLKEHIKRIEREKDDYRTKFTQAHTLAQQIIKEAK